MISGEDYSTLESLKNGTVAGGQSANSGPYSFLFRVVLSGGFLRGRAAGTQQAQAQGQG